MSMGRLARRCAIRGWWRERWQRRRLEDQLIWMFGFLLDHRAEEDRLRADNAKLRVGLEEAAAMIRRQREALKEVYWHEAKKRLPDGL